MSKAFDRVWHAGLLHKLKSYGIFGQIFGLSSFLSNRQLRVVLDGKGSQEYRVNAGVSQGYILGLTLFLLYINNLPDDIMCDIAIYADNTTVYSKWIRHLICGNNLNWLLNLNLIYETLDWGKKWLVDFIAGETQLVSLDKSNENGSVDVKMDGTLLEEK